MNKYPYEVISVREESKASTVIDKYAPLGWRLHIFYYMAETNGSFMNGALKQYVVSNIFHLVFEKEVPLSSAEISERRSLENESCTLADKKARDLANLERMRNKKRTSWFSAKNS